MSSTAPTLDHASVNNNSYASDEIDLRELIRVLWKSRVLIIAVTAIVVALAAVYAYTTVPIYQAQATALPPSAAGLDAYNKAYRMSGPAVDGITKHGDPARERFQADAIPALSPDDVYEHFIRHLNSTALRRDFFENQYLPLQGFSDPGALTTAEYDQAWQQFRGRITVAAPVRSMDNQRMTTVWTGTDNQRVTVTWVDTDSLASAEWANLFMRAGVEATQRELANNLESSVQILRKSLDDQVTSLRSGARQERERRIIRLTEALQLAESIGLRTPSDAGNLVASYSGETAYMRGADALRNEIVLLENRASDDPFIPELTGVLMRQALLDMVSVSAEEISVARFDGVAVPSTSPIKPRKKLILALGLVLGGVLGIFIVLARNMLRD